MNMRETNPEMNEIVMAVWTHRTILTFEWQNRNEDLARHLYGPEHNLGLIYNAYVASSSDVHTAR